MGTTRVPTPCRSPNFRLMPLIKSSYMKASGGRRALVESGKAPTPDFEPLSTRTRVAASWEAKPPCLIMSNKLHLPIRKFERLAGEGFVTRFSRTRAQKKLELHKLALAHSDVHAAYKTAEHFLEVIGPIAVKKPGLYAGMDQPLYNPLIEAFIISYSRPFVPNKSLGELSKDWGTFSDTRLQKAHRRILQARNELIAHSDGLVRRVKIHPPSDSESKAVPRMGLGFGIRTYWFTLSQIGTFYHTASDLGQRLLKAAEALLEELYGGMDLPAKEFELNRDDGL